MLRLNKEKRSRVKHVVALFVCATPLLSTLVFGDFIIGNDGYFHIKYSSLLTEGIDWRTLPWMQFSIRRETFRDHHFLFHILYMPFTAFGLSKGASLAASFFASSALFSFYCLLRHFTVRYALLWTLVLSASSFGFLFRLLMPRVQSMALLLLLAGLYSCSSNRKYMLAAISFVFVWLYDGFFLLIILVLCFSLSVSLSGERFPGRLVAANATGTALGLVFNPYFPQNFASYWFNLVRITRPDPPYAMSDEWFALDTWLLLSSNAIAFLVFLIGVGLIFSLPQRINKTTLTAFLLSVFFLVLYCKSMRAVEYWAPFTILFAALSFRDWAGAYPQLTPSRLGIGKLWICGCVLAAVIFAGVNVKHIYSRVQTEPAAERLEAYRGPSDWLRQNTTPGTLVYNVNIYDFPVLFYLNSENYYVVGLDPAYMEKFNSELHSLYRGIAESTEPEPVKTIRDVFGAEYVILKKEGNEKTVYRIDADPASRRAYEDSDSIVFKLTQPLDIQYLTAFLPHFFRPNINDVLILGYGSGLVAATCLKLTNGCVDCLDVEKEALTSSQSFRDMTGSPVECNRFGFRVAKELNFQGLVTASRHLIVAQNTNVWGKDRWNTYTLDFYKTLKLFLASDGVFAQVVNANVMNEREFLSVLKTVDSVFKFTCLFSFDGTYFLLVGSDEPLEFNMSNLSLLQRKCSRYPELIDNLDLYGGKDNIKSLVLAATLLNSDQVGQLLADTLDIKPMSNRERRMGFAKPNSLHHYTLANEGVIARKVCDVVTSEAWVKACESLEATSEQNDAIKDKVRFFDSVGLEIESRELVDYGIEMVPSEQFYHVEKLLETRISTGSEVLEEVKAIIKKSRKDANRLGVELWRRNEREEAVLVFELITAEYPDRWLGWYNLGMNYQALGQREKASRALSRATLLRESALQRVYSDE